jgi:hypothetical protein
MGRKHRLEWAGLTFPWSGCWGGEAEVRGVRWQGGCSPRRPGSSLEGGEKVLRDGMRLQHGVRRELGVQGRVSVQKSSGREELVRLLLSAVAQGFNDASSDSIRVEVAACPVEEVPFVEGRGALLHELCKVCALAHRTGPLVGRRDSKAMLSAFPLYPFHYRQCFGLPVPSRASQ